MKIAQIVCAFPPYNGGIGQSAQRFAEILSQNHKITTFTLKPENINVKNSDKVKYLHPFFRYGHGALPFSLLISLLKFDCIYLHYPFFGASEIIWLFSLFSKKRLIIHYHMDTAKLPFPLSILTYPNKLIRKSLFKKADQIVCSSLDYVNNGEIKNLVKKWPDKFKDLPFGLDAKVYCPKIPLNNHGLLAKAKELVNFVTKNFIKKGKVNILFVGGLDKAHYFKGLPVLFKALSLINEDQWQLNIVGTGSLQSSYNEQAKNLGLSSKTKFLGKLSEDELIRAYQEADFLILPSINSHEAFGLVLIEAMSCAVPVIASNLIGVRTVFRDKQDGFLVEVSNAQDLADKISFLINNEEIRVNMGKSAREYVLKKYSWTVVSSQLKKIFYENNFNK